MDYWDIKLIISIDEAWVISKEEAIKNGGYVGCQINMVPHISLS